MAPALKSFEILVIADLDAKSREPDTDDMTFFSYLQHGLLTHEGSSKNDEYSITWGAKQKVTSSLNAAGRGFELSELAWYQDKLLTFDERTGTVFVLTGFGDGEQLKAIPKEVVKEGNGDSGKGQRHEWATVKDGKLYMGSNGVPMVDANGTVVSDANNWIAILHEDKTIEKVNWADNYEKVRKALGCSDGYVSHEAVRWSTVHRKWFMLPRRVSADPFDKKLNELRGSNKLVIASEDFQNIRVVDVGVVTPERGFSSFHFVPHTNESVVVAIKGVELHGDQDTFLTVFDIKGHVLLRETRLPGHYKYEGLNFARDWSADEARTAKSTWASWFPWLN